MKLPVVIVLAGVITTALTALAPPLQAQACKDEKDTAQAMVQDVAQTVDEVKKESQADFETKYHRKSCLNKLTFAAGAVGEAVTCLAKAGQDASAGADPAAAAKSEGDADAKLKDRLTHYRDSLKSTDDQKAAKALIATFDIPTAPPK
ncbi:MAG TPA: hypothetical protein VL523_12110 [Terriglobia bacterium]|nr:hypothetical protein [Terriglobia bacterium]